VYYANLFMYVMNNNIKTTFNYLLGDWVNKIDTNHKYVISYQNNPTHLHTLSHLHLTPLHTKPISNHHTTLLSPLTIPLLYTFYSFTLHSTIPMSPLHIHAKKLILSIYQFCSYDLQETETFS
jgi:hypothetical protein